MKIQLQQDVKGIGRRGQIVEVSDAQARNFLFPRKLAVPASSAIVAAHARQLVTQEKERKSQQERIATAVQVLSQTTVRVSGKASPAGKLFAAVKSVDMQRAAESATGLSMSGVRTIPDHVKAVGTHTVDFVFDDQHRVSVTVVVDHAA
jgi:large subunit ribosomal protein L9